MKQEHKIQQFSLFTNYMLGIEELLSISSFHPTKRHEICPAAAATEPFQIGVIWRWVQFIFQNLHIIPSIFQPREEV